MAIPNSVARGPYDGNSVWNLLDSGFEQGSALFSVKDLCNVLRALDEEDQRQFSFAMTRVLAHGRYKEARCEGLFKALQKAHEALQDHVVKGNRLKGQRNSARQELVNVKDDLLTAKASLTSLEEQISSEREEVEREASVAMDGYFKRFTLQATQLDALSKELPRVNGTAGVWV